MNHVGTAANRQMALPLTVPSDGPPDEIQALPLTARELRAALDEMPVLESLQLVSCRGPGLGPWMMIPGWHQV